MSDLRARCAALIAGIDVPMPFDVRVLCERVGDHLARPIVLLPASLPAQGPCGLVLSGVRAHYLCYDQDTPPLHQQHIIAHELGHLLAGHHAGVWVSGLLPSLNPERVRRALARSHGRAPGEEQEAEMIAELLLRHAYRLSGEPRWQVPDVAAEVISRIERTLG